MTHVPRKFRFSNLSAVKMAFCHLIVDGESGTEAYIRAYKPKGTNLTSRVQACRILKNPDVVAYIEQLKKKSEDKKTLVRIEKRIWLAKFVRDAKEDTGKRIKAIEVDNEMTGDNSPQKVEVFGLSELLGMVRKNK